MSDLRTMWYLISPAEGPSRGAATSAEAGPSSAVAAAAPGPVQAPPPTDLVPAAEFDALADRYHELVHQVQDSAERVGRAEAMAEVYKERIGELRVENERLRDQLDAATRPKRGRFRRKSAN